MLFDKDEDGVLTFHELEQVKITEIRIFGLFYKNINQVMQALGQRPDQRKLLQMVR